MSPQEASPLPYPKCKGLPQQVATGYTRFLSAFSDVGPRSKTIATAEVAFRENIIGILESFQMNPADLARLLRSVKGPSKKTVYNLLSGKHPPNLKTWGAAADVLGVPLWVILIPGLSARRELLEPSQTQALEKLVNDYLICGEEARDSIRRVADGCAVLERHKRRP